MFNIKTILSKNKVEKQPSRLHCGVNTPLETNKTEVN